MTRSFTLCALAMLLCVFGYMQLHPDVGDPDLIAVMLEEIWLPTAIMALLTGALFASSGVFIQTVLDNDFASPSTVGITAGALFGAIMVRLFFPHTATYWMWLGAFSGAFSLAMLVLLTSKLIGGGRLPVVLIGMALGLGFGALGSVIMVYFENEMDGLFLWGSGQVLQTSSVLLNTMSPFIFICLIASLLVLPKLALFSLGDLHAKRLGLAVMRWRWIVLIIAVAQASLATALVGMIGFVGLIAPHIARYLVFWDKYRSTAKHTSPNQGGLLPVWLCSLLIGAILVLCAEWASRSFLFIGYRLPTGAFTALLGAPFFIFLLLRHQGKALADTEKQQLSLNTAFRPNALVILMLLVLVLLGSIGYWLPAFWSSESRHAHLALDWEIQRVLLAALSGFGLAIAGALLQTLFRNPMASPDISGVSAMSILCIALLLVLFPNASQSALFVAGFVGAGTVLVFLVWGFKQQLSVSQIALIGITITAFTGTLTHILLTFGSSTASTTLLWLIGTTYAASQEQTLPLAITILACLLALLPCIRELDILPLGDALPKTLGIPTSARNLYLLSVAAILTAMCVSSVGAISFIGLLAPHCARLLGLHFHQHVLPASGMIGATLLIWADGIGRTFVAPNEVAAGMVVSILGSGYFLLLLLLGYRKRHERFD